MPEKEITLSDLEARTASSEEKLNSMMRDLNDETDKNIRLEGNRA